MPIFEKLRVQYRFLQVLEVLVMKLRFMLADMRFAGHMVIRT